MEKHVYEKYEECDDWKPADWHESFEPERDVENIGIHRNPFARSFIYPRMFIISPTGEGLELLSQDQIDQIVKFNQYKGDSLTTSRVEYVENT